MFMKLIKDFENYAIYPNGTVVNVTTGHIKSQHLIIQAEAIIMWIYITMVSNNDFIYIVL